MTDERLRKPRRKPKAGLHLLESPFPIPIETITGREAEDGKWYYYFGSIQNNHVVVSRLGDLTFLYRLGFFGKGILSRSRPQFETYSDVLSDYSQSNYIRSKAWRANDEYREKMRLKFIQSQIERLRQHSKWSSEQTSQQINTQQTSTLKSDSSPQSMDDEVLSQCVDLHTTIDDGQMEEDSTDGENDPLLSQETEKSPCTELTNNEQFPISNDAQNDSISSQEKRDAFAMGNDCPYEANTDKNIDKNENIDSEKRESGSTNFKEANSVMNSDVVINDESAKIDDHNDKKEDLVGTPTPLKRCLSMDNISFNELKKKFKLDDDKYKVYECLQLTFEEAFFLSYGLGCLGITKEKDGSIQNCMGIREIWNYYCTHKRNFLQQYIAYHHFRSKGWVVRYGNMFGADFALYKDGMPFYHASYSVFVLLIDENSETNQSSQLSWKQLSTMSRVNEKVAKEVLLCYVIRPKGLTSLDELSPSCIHDFRVMEVIFRRWIPEKHREMQEVT